MTELPDWITVLFLFFIGACIGSFLNVCIFRLPEGKSVVSPPSACPSCGHRIRWWENIPVLSFILLRQKCSNCGSRISLQYPAIEAINGIFYVLLWLKFGTTPSTLVYCIFFSALLVITVIDLRHYIIPDVISLPGIAAGFAASFLIPGMTWLDSIMGIVLGGGILFAVAWGYYLLTGREGMGGGDIKLLAMIGAFLGWKAVPAIIFFSALVGSIVGVGTMVMNKKDRHHALPYGPFLAGAAIFYLFYGREIIQWYLRLITPQA